MRLFPVAVPTAALLIVAAPSLAAAQGTWLLLLDAPAALPMSKPQSARFGPGAMPAAAAMRAFGPWALLGVRLRAGVLLDGPAPTDPDLKDYSLGGLLSATAAARLRLLPGADETSRAAGPYLEVAAGAGLTGTLLRPTIEAAVGWDFAAGAVTLGPTLRYLQLMQPDASLEAADARMALVGLEIVLFDPRPDVRRNSPRSRATPEKEDNP